jgi:hypothetical protein
MQSNTFMQYAAALVAATALVSAANATTISWGTAQTITGDASVLTNGTFLSASSAGVGATVTGAGSIDVTFSGAANFWGNGQADTSSSYYTGAGSTEFNTVLDTQNYASGTKLTTTVSD